MGGNWLRSAMPFLVVLVFTVLALGYGEAKKEVGYQQGLAVGEAELTALRLEHATQTQAATADAFRRYREQVTRANDAEDRLLQSMDERVKENQHIEERIAHVSKQFRPAPGAKAQPAPHCVFTVGWLRDFNTALGVPGASTGPVTSRYGKAPWSAPGTDAGLLESGVTPADILSHAIDYGHWARGLADQVNALLQAREHREPAP